MTDFFFCILIHIIIILYNSQMLRDFAQRFPAIDERALLLVWPGFSTNIELVLRQFDTRNTFATEWTGDVAALLMFLKLLPNSVSGRNIVASPLTFQKAVKRLIVFSKV